MPSSIWNDHQERGSVGAGYGNYRAELKFVLKAEEAEREKIRAKRVKQEEGGLVRSKKKVDAPVTDDGVFEVDHEVLGSATYKSEIGGSHDHFREL